MKPLFDLLRNQHYKTKRTPNNKSKTAINRHHLNERFLWIGCLDFPESPFLITGFSPHQLLVVRNVANLVTPQNPEIQATLQYAFSIPSLRTIIVCGHYDCRCVAMTLYNIERNHNFQPWVRPIRDIISKYWNQLENLNDLKTRARKLVELNVITQVEHLSENQLLLERGNIQIFGWVYDASNGFIHEVAYKECGGDVI